MSVGEASGSCKGQGRIGLVKKCLKGAPLLCLIVELSLLQGISSLSRLSFLFGRCWVITPTQKAGVPTAWTLVLQSTQRTVSSVVILLWTDDCWSWGSFPIRGSGRLVSCPCLQQWEHIAVGATVWQRPTVLCRSWLGAAGSHHLLTAYIKFTTSRKFYGPYVDSFITHIEATWDK